MNRVLKAIIEPWKHSAAFGALFSVIPGLNFLFLGYILKVVRHAKEDKEGLPEWKNLGDLFIKGVYATVIMAVFFLPYMILMLLLAFTSHIQLNIMFLPVMIILHAAAILTPAYVLPSVLYRFERYGWKRAWHLKTAWHEVKNYNYLKRWIIGGVLAFLISSVSVMLQEMTIAFWQVGPIPLMTVLILAFGMWWAFVTSSILYGQGLNPKRGVAMAKKKKGKVTHKAADKGPSMSLPIVAILIVIIIAGGLGMYMWYTSRQLPAVGTEQGFKEAVWNCQPAQIDIATQNGKLKFETRWCDVIDVRVKQAPNEAKGLQDRGMRCRVPAEKLQEINLGEIVKMPNYCEGELKRDPKRILLIA